MSNTAVRGEQPQIRVSLARVGDVMARNVPSARERADYDSQQTQTDQA